MAKTQAEPSRDPKADHLLTPENCALVLIDYQPEQYRTVTSSTREEIDRNVKALRKLAACHRARESSDKFRKVSRWSFPKRSGLMKEGKIGWAQ